MTCALARAVSVSHIMQKRWSSLENNGSVTNCDKPLSGKPRRAVSHIPQTLSLQLGQYHLLTNIPHMHANVQAHRQGYMQACSKTCIYMNGNTRTIFRRATMSTCTGGPQMSKTLRGSVHEAIKVFSFIKSQAQRCHRRPPR